MYSSSTIVDTSRGAGWIMDYGFHGFMIHQIHNPWILDGFGFTNPKLMDIGWISILQITSLEFGRRTRTKLLNK